MAEKIRLGIIGDCGVETGFATVTHNLIKQLQATGEYQIKVIAINYDGKTDNEWAKYIDMWPARLGGDLLGVGLISQLVNEFKPNVFLMFQDFWNIPMFVSRLPENFTGSVAYFPVDAPNIKGAYMLSMAGINSTICYTEFGREEAMRGSAEAWEQLKAAAIENKKDILDRVFVTVGGGISPITGVPIAPRQVAISAYRLKQMKTKEGHFVIPHGVDVQAFNPVSKKGARKILGLPLNGFFVGYVGRNQSRKRQDLAIRAFADFSKIHSDAYLLLHCVKTDVQGWDLEQLAQYYGVRDKVIFTHVMFKDMAASIDQLNLLYNTFDVHINTSGGEGWGLPNFESAAVGVPQVVPNWSATKELWENSGKLIDIASVRHEPHQINTMQAVVDTHSLVNILNELHDNPALREEIGKKCYEVTQRPEYRWESVAKQFDTVFKNSIDKKIPMVPVAVTSAGQVEMAKALKTGLIK